MTVNAKNLTEGASKALARSRQIAIANNSMVAATEHCLAALIEQDNSPVTQLLQQVIASTGKSKEVVIGDLRVKVNSFIKSMKLSQSAAKFVHDHQSPSLGRAIQVAAFYCQKASVPVAEIHLLLGLLLTPEIDKVNNVAAIMIAEWASCSTVETKAGEYDKIVGTFREAAKSASNIPGDLFDLSAAPPRYTSQSSSSSVCENCKKLEEEKKKVEDEKKKLEEKLDCSEKDNAKLKQEKEGEKQQHAQLLNKQAERLREFSEQKQKLEADNTSLKDDNTRHLSTLRDQANLLQDLKQKQEASSGVTSASGGGNNEVALARSEEKMKALEAMLGKAEAALAEARQDKQKAEERAEKLMAKLLG